LITFALTEKNLLNQKFLKGMISIIICSRLHILPNWFKKNIADTIGVEYELIHVDNSEKKYTIFEAYAEGLSRSKFNCLCFMHDDLLFHTQNWGKILIKHFNQNSNWGIIACAGCKILRKTHALWSIPEYNAFNIIQTDIKHGSEQKVWQTISQPEKVIAVDGMWICARREVFEKVKFDTLNYTPAFHFYDLDFSMQVYQAGFDVVIVPDILIEHLSLGSFEAEWLTNNKVFFKKWKKYLPVNLAGVDNKTMQNLEWKAFISMLRYIKEYKAYYLFFDVLIRAFEVQIEYIFKKNK